MAAEVVLVGLAAFACGLVNSVAGGGSLLLFPALLSTGMGSVAANVTNSVSTLPGYLGGALGFHAELRRHRTWLPRLAAAAVVGSAAGSALLLLTPESTFDLLVPPLVAVAAVIIGLQPRIRRSIPHGGSASPAAGFAGVAAATVYGGYFGGGLGVILLAVLGLALRAPLSELNGLKSALSVVSAAVTVLVFGAFGPVRWWWVALASPMTLLGGYVGSQLARRLHEDVLRRCVVGFGLAVAVGLAVT